MAKKILVLSPHLDDVALSCSDFCLHKKKHGYQIQVINFFTNFGKNKKFQNKRIAEDKAAMQLLGFSYINLGLNDAKFRNQHVVHKNNSFIRNPNKTDTKIKKELRKIFNKLPKSEIVLVPLGLGNHVDHVLIKNMALDCLGKLEIYFYVDQPYALHLKNWKISHLRSILVMKKIISKPNKKRSASIKLYKSQLNDLFKKIYLVDLYPQIILKK